MKLKKASIIILAFIPLLVCLIMLFILPEQIPARYNEAGEITRWGSKLETLIMPVFLIVFMGAFYSSFCNCVKAGKDKLTLNAIFFGALAVGVTFNCINFVFLYRICQAVF